MHHHYQAAAAHGEFKLHHENATRPQCAVITNENSLLTKVLGRGCYLDEWALRALQDNRKLIVQATRMLIRISQPLSADYSILKQRMEEDPEGFLNDDPMKEIVLYQVGSPSES